MLKEITEKKVTELWQNVAQNGSNFYTVDKQKVQVVYPGRSSDVPGADVKDAVLNINGQVTKGDIEIHVRSSDWRTHRHHMNTAYNGIILHVVMWSDTSDITRLENGCGIPIISLDKQSVPAINKSNKKLVVPGCTGKSRDINEEKMAGVLDSSGEARFREKQSVFSRELENTDVGQCFYSGIMSALGYSRNSIPFQIVSDKLPLAILESVIRENPEELVPARLEALLLGTSGFLPGQQSGGHCTAFGDTWTLKIEREWFISECNQALFLEDWHLFRIRPGNFPVRRLAGMAHLLQRYQKYGLLVGLAEMMKLASQAELRWQMESGLIVTAEGYWIDHFNLGKQCHKLGRFLIGPSRAAEILVNVVLPFYAACGEHGIYPEIGEKAFGLYCDYPGITENTIGRHMCVQLGLKPSQVKSACRQQGLLHLYKRFCTEGRCNECLLFE